MIRVILEIDPLLYRLLQSAAKTNHLSFDEECRRRLEGTERRSRYLQALVCKPGSPTAPIATKRWRERSRTTSELGFRTKLLPARTSS